MVSTNQNSALNEDKLDLILKHLEERKTSVYGPGDPNRVYTNKEMMQLLGIDSRYLKRLRDEGYIGYSRVGDKYWYTQRQLDEFFKRFGYEAFTSASSLPPFSKGAAI